MTFIITWTKAERELVDGTDTVADGSDDVEMGPGHLLEAILEEAPAYHSVTKAHVMHPIPLPDICP